MLLFEILYAGASSHFRHFRKYCSAATRYPWNYFSLIPSRAQQENRLRQRAVKLSLYGSEEPVLRVRLPERWTPIWTLMKKGLQHRHCNPLIRLVEQMGFEPTTYALRTHRSPS